LSNDKNTPCKECGSKETSIGPIEGAYIICHKCGHVDEVFV